VNPRHFHNACGIEIPRLGQGTWHMGEDASAAQREIVALRLGLDLGIRMIDTAEMYANGGAERIVGEAIAGRRDEVFLVSKVLPGNASRRGTIQACEASLRRLGTDHLDLYLLHWEGQHPLEDTLDAFRELRERGRIRAFGVSNFDLDAYERAWELAPGEIACNQLLYNPTRRGIERRLLPRCLDRGTAIMAYSPFEQGRLHRDGVLWELARAREVDPYQIVLAWVLREEGVLAIPKSSHPVHVQQNAQALELQLSDEELALLDREFPMPDKDGALEWL
jgi:diketogulonate reductase-like aldo/keto reductase